MGYVHVGAECCERFVEVVHLRRYTDRDHDGEDVGRGAGKLVVASESHLERQTEALDRHDGDGACRRADAEVYHGIPLAVLRRYEVDHEDVKRQYQETVGEET